MTKQRLKALEQDLHVQVQQAIKQGYYLAPGLPTQDGGRCLMAAMAPARVGDLCSCGCGMIMLHSNYVAHAATLLRITTHEARALEAGFESGLAVLFAPDDDALNDLGDRLRDTYC